jgi:hypothetical protein
MALSFKQGLRENSTKWLAKTVLRDGVGSKAVVWIQDVHDLAGFSKSENLITHILHHLVYLWLIPEHSLSRKEPADGASSDAMSLSTPGSQ